MKTGDFVKLRAFRDMVIERRIIQVLPDVVVICTNEEYLKSLKENRQPTGIGFRLADVISVNIVRSSVRRVG